MMLKISEMVRDTDIVTMK